MKRYLSLAFAFAVLLLVISWTAPLSARSDDTSLPEIANAISANFEAYHYNPAELDTAAYRALDSDMHALALSAPDVDAFLEGFAELWADGPFSHVRLVRAQQSAEAMAAYFDQLDIGGGGAVLDWQDDIAVLTVNTMMGRDTIAEIEAAYDRLAERQPRALIVDLRYNDGGAFAVIPLVEHALTEPLDAGAFVSQRWNAQMNRAPTEADLGGLEPWTGWSIRDFWRNVQDNRLTWLRFEPAPNRFEGPVFVLVSNRTASAAELAADAFRASGRALLIGETTAGRMLSQKMYDLPGGLQLSLPIADYYSIAHGRIEGVGVPPHIMTMADDAMNVALDRARRY